MPTQSVLPTCKTTGNEYEMPHKQGWQTEPSHTFKLKRGFILPFPNGISITQSSSRSDKFFLSFNLKSSTCCSAFSLYSREQDFTFWPSSWTNESEVMTLGSQDQLFCFSPGSAPEIVPQLLLGAVYWSLKEIGGEWVDGKGQIQPHPIKNQPKYTFCQA